MILHRNLFVIEYEVNLLRLLDKLMNGMCLEVNETGTSFSFTPGSLVGGQIDHECCKLRGIGYYLEVIFAIAPFCKKSISITLRGITNNQVNINLIKYKCITLLIFLLFFYFL